MRLATAAALLSSITMAAQLAGRRETAANLLRLGAPRAAARLGLGVARVRAPFAVEAFTDVADAATAEAFAAALRGAAEVAFDAEWRPDGPEDDHAPSLAQVAVRGGGVYLLDLEVDAVREPALAALEEALWSEDVIVYGFGARTDLEKLALLRPGLRGARRLRDLEDAGAGLKDAVHQHTFFTIDKKEQCSDWKRRPLTPAQRSYAAADAAVLLALSDALEDQPAEQTCAVTARTLRGAAPPRASRAAQVDAAAVRGVIVDVADARGVECNALCVAAGADRLLVLFPASEQLDWKWFALATGRSRRQLKLATWDQCVGDFGAEPGRVPPVPLRENVRVFAHPALVAAPALVGSTGDEETRLVFPGDALPSFAEVLPDPALYASDLDDALDRFAAEKKVMLDNALQSCARKLRMIGVDAAVAGEVLNEHRGVTPRGHRRGGLDRVRVDAARIDGDLRAAALEGRVVVVPPRRSCVGAHYVLATKGGDANFDELLDVLDLRGSVEYWGSRCGICNGGDWRSLDKDAVVDDVPAAVVDSEDEFYQCGVCGQIFWPGRKYDDKMNGLKNLALNDDEDARLLKDAVHKFRVSPPPR